MKNRLKLFFIISCSTLLGFNGVLLAKPFHRVLVISGGGLNPGTPLGIIHGAIGMGWKPDLIIAICGFSIGGVLYNGSDTLEENLRDLHSEGLFRGYRSTEVTNSWLWDVVPMINRTNDRYVYPQIFADILLHVPQTFPIQLDHERFSDRPTDPKMIFVGAKALFGPEKVGQAKTIFSPLFKTVFFTDNSTASFLHDVKHKRHQAFPYSNVLVETETETRLSTIEAFRASISDPYLLDPLYFDNSYYFTGAIDQHSLDMALSLGDEVMVTYPKELLNKVETAVIESTFGFTPNVRLLESIQLENIKWIDMTGADDLSFNPKMVGVKMTLEMPEDQVEFEHAVDRQYNFGLQRVREALTVPPYSQRHLRKPISKALFREFSCKNAFAWKTPDNDYCESDLTEGCNRLTAAYCNPLR